MDLKFELLKKLAIPLTILPDNICYYCFMHKNIGTTDRIIRISLGIILIGVGYYTRSGMLVLGGLFSVYEGVSSWCVLYQFLGVNTCGLKNSNAFQSKQILQVFMQGIVIFLVAVILNIFANMLGWITWYQFLQSPSLTLTLDNYIFLFFLYPLGLGLSAKFSAQIYS